MKNVLLAAVSKPILRFACAALLLVAPEAIAQSAIYYRSFSGDYIGQGQTVLGQAPQWTFSATHSDGGKRVRIQMDGAGLNQSLWFTSHTATLTPGGYEEAARDPFQGTSPGLDFSGNGRGCNQLRGRFSVLEAEFGPGSMVTRFAANFEQWCDNSDAPLFGEIRINSTVPLGIQVTTPDSMPDPFSLGAQNPVQAGSVVTSNAFTLYGVNSPVPVSIQGGEYRINNGAYTSTPGTALERDVISVRLTAPFTGGATRQATLDAGGQTATFSVTTYLAGTPLTGIYYRSPGNPSANPPTVEYIGQGKTRLHLTPYNEITASRNFDNGATFRLEGVGGTHFTLDFAAPGEVTLTPGTYEGATRFPFQAPTAPGLDFSGDGRGCNQSTGRFVVHEAVYNPDNSIQRFAADFEQTCDSSVHTLVGEVRYNSAIAFSTLQGVFCTAADTDGDGVPDCIEVAQGTNPDIKDNDVFGNARLFVQQLYRDFLNREGDTAGVDYWTGVITSGAMTRAQTVEQFVNSPEFEAASSVARLYFAYFLRVPDYEGLTYWMNLRATSTLEDISDAFAGSAEFQQRYGQMGNRQFVELVYRNVLGRPADPEGLAAWRSELDNLRMTWGEVMLAFSESAEYRALIRHEVIVTMTYVRMLRRSPEAAGFSAWVSYFDAGSPTVDFIGQVLASPEYRRRFLP